MTRRLLLIDRLACLVVGLGLIAAGLAALDWHYDLFVTEYPDQVSTGSLEDVLASSWWPWAFAAGGVLLGLIGIAWLLAHLRRRPRSTLRLSASDPTGRLDVDLGSVAAVVAARYADLTPTTGVRGRLVSSGSHHLIEITGHVDPRADVTSLAQAAATCAADLATGLPGEDVSCRVLLGSPRRRGAEREDSVRVG